MVTTIKKQHSPWLPFYTYVRTSEPAVFPTSPQFSLPNHVISGSGDVPSGSGTSLPVVCARHPTGRQFPGSHDNPSTNQKPPALDQSEATLLAM